jgi:hypothetical protein
MTKLKHSNSTKPPLALHREIHRQVKVLGRTQAAVATEFKRDKGQVSRIVKRVDRWLGGATREVQGELPDLAQRRLDRWLARERAEDLYAEARRLMAEAGQESGVRGQESDDRDRLRWASLRVQAMKVAMRASQDLHELSEAEPLPEPTPAVDDKHWLERTIDGLVPRRAAAEQAGLVPRSLNVRELIESTLAILMGKQVGYDCSGYFGPGTARWELAAALVRMCDDEDWFTAAAAAIHAAHPRRTMPAAPFVPGPHNAPGAQPRNPDPQPASARSPSNDYIGSPAMMATYNDPMCGRIPEDALRVAREEMEQLRATALANAAAAPAVGCISPPRAQCTTSERVRRRYRR